MLLVQDNHTQFEHFGISVVRFYAYAATSQTHNKKRVLASQKLPTPAVFPTATFDYMSRGSCVSKAICYASHIAFDSSWNIIKI